MGYLIVHDQELTELKDEDPANLALRLDDAMTRISDGGGKICLLPAQFIHLKPGAPLDDYSIVLMLLLLFALSTSIILYDKDKVFLTLDFGKTDEVGIAFMVVLMTTVFLLPVLVPHFAIDDDGLLTFEYNKDVRDFTEGLANGSALIAPYPASTDDNPDFQANALIDLGLDFSNQFGIYHQKFSILKNAGGHIAYCGGIDLNPNRLDDEHHMAKSPYHDTHVRIEGAAEGRKAEYRF